MTDLQEMQLLIVDISRLYHNWVDFEVGHSCPQCLDYIDSTFATGIHYLAFAKYMAELARMN